eukprot:TRINITY_DN15571_c0_g1_i1.p1 TRINITY_DN15571_c0_g1~~TRINITY_DN15571_c0_g1_i1.p1  ORF type:complete len:315 (+),score=56.19 TRINITY_DN15571_c0_g1_i1:42-947(+)
MCIRDSRRGLIPILNELIPKLKDMNKLQFDALVSLGYIMDHLRVDKHPVFSSLTGISNAKRDIMEGLLSTNDQAVLAFVLKNRGPKDDEELKSTMLKLGDSFFRTDESAYDAILQQYEFGTTLAGELGVHETTTWSSCALMAEVYASENYFHPNLVQRLENIIHRKAETDVVDFDSAATLLQGFLSAGIEDISLNLRLIQMIHTQISSEGKLALIHFDGENITLFLEALLQLYSPEDTDYTLVPIFFEYFEGFIRNPFEYEGRLSRNDLISLKRIYESATFYKPRNPEFFGILDKKIKDGS